MRTTDPHGVEKLHHSAGRHPGGRGSVSSQTAPDALYRSLRRRAERTGITDFRPHRLRHTAVHRWLAAGGSESGLMAMAGWTRVEMLIRYTRANGGERARRCRSTTPRPRTPLTHPSVRLA